MGNLKEKSFEKIWNGKEAEIIRELIKNCSKNCWMIGNVGEIMKKHIGTPTKWIVKKKILRQCIC